MRRPHRRSRKIGLTQGGRVRDGKANEKGSRVFTRDVWLRLSGESDVRWRVLRENPSRDFCHPVGVRAIRGVLDRLPEELTDGVAAIVLRRLPKVDERLGVEARRRWSVVILNAFPKDRRQVWTGGRPRAAMKHNEPWCDRWTKEGDDWVLSWTRDEARRYYLYHLLLHEVGHLNEPRTRRGKRAESFAEDFALTWARRLGELE